MNDWKEAWKPLIYTDHRFDRNIAGQPTFNVLIERLSLLEEAIKGALKAT
jgi:hypothetical protein